jgi:hypothetical protein
MDNVLTDMVQRLRAIEILLRTQNELLVKVIGSGSLTPAKATFGRSAKPSFASGQVEKKSKGSTPPCKPSSK